MKSVELHGSIGLYNVKYFPSTEMSYIFLNITPCNLEKFNRHWFHVYFMLVFASLTLRPWKWRSHSPWKRWLTFTAVYQKTETFTTWMRCSVKGTRRTVAEFSILRFDLRCIVRKGILGQDFVVCSLQRKKFQTKEKSRLRMKGYSRGRPNRLTGIGGLKKEQVVDIILEVGEGMVLKPRIQHHQYIQQVLLQKEDGACRRNNREAICAGWRKGKCVYMVCARKITSVYEVLRCLPV